MDAKLDISENGKINVEWSSFAHKCNADNSTDGYKIGSAASNILKVGDVIRVSDLRGFNLVITSTALNGVKCRLHEMHNKKGVYQLPFINSINVWKLKTK